MSFSLFKSLPVQLILCLVGGLFLGEHLNNDTINILYTISCLLKEILMFALPVIIFSYLFAALLAFEKQAPLLILTMLVLVTISNALTALAAYGAMAAAAPFLVGTAVQMMAAGPESIHSLFALNLPTMPPENAMIGGLLMGLITNAFRGNQKSDCIKQMAFKLRDGSTFGLQKLFIPLLPLYVLGFVLKLDRDGSLGTLIQHFGRIFVVECVVIVAYVVLMYAIAAKFNWSAFARYIKEMLPAGLTGFSTMSSAATMPVTLAATEKNLNDREYADFVIPTTVNIHLIGDGISIAIIALALLLLSGQGLPNFTTYLVFTVYYCLAKFSVAGVPGGGVFVALPVILKYLELSPETATMLTTVYVLQDPIITATNVMGNGAFAIITKRWLHSK
ncbi:MAG: cation:dicarboxylase symporter family transporter [Alphaproteobacteria bacterium]|nr:cation:dicarboxylase symporter family transporter [Alphaproteobacteria bacterium]